MLTSTEENYIKSIFKISENEKSSVSTNALAEMLGTSAASVTDMLKKLADKSLVNYKKYRGVSLTAQGKIIATKLVRKHRLWEVFLVEKLRFSWEQVHDIAEELEHIKSDELVSRLDAYLDYPKFDPHGDPIPNADGKFTIRNQFQLSELIPGHEAMLVGVRKHETSFLEYLNNLKIKIGSNILVKGITSYDKSMDIIINNKSEATISHQTAQSLLMKRV